MENNQAETTSEEQTPKNSTETQQQEKSKTEQKGNDDELSKDTLVQLLKEKTKEIKQVNTKLSKLENKYVKVFKAQKSFTKDRENFMQVLSHIFSKESSEEYKSLRNIELGNVDSKTIIQLFLKRESDKEKAMNQIISDFNKDKQQMEHQFKQQIQEKVSNMDEGNQQLVQQLREQIEDLENTNTKLAKETIILNQVIQQKNDQLESLEKKEDMLTKIQTDELIHELQLNNKKTSESLDVSQRIKISELENNVISLERDLEQAQEKITQLEKSQNNNNNGSNSKISPQVLSFQKSNSIQQQIKKQHSQVTSETQTDSIFDPNTGLFVDRVSLQNEQFNRQYGLQIEQPKAKQAISFQPHPLDDNNDEIEDLGQDSLSKEERMKLNEEYLKNVILKYFEYLESKQHKEAGLLQNSIMTILRMTPEEKSRIEEARSKGSIWSYIPFLNKGGSVDSTGKNNYQSEILQTQ